MLFVLNINMPLFLYYLSCTNRRFIQQAQWVPAANRPLSNIGRRCNALTVACPFSWILIFWKMSRSFLNFWFPRWHRTVIVFVCTPRFPLGVWGPHAAKVSWKLMLNYRVTFWINCPQNRVAMTTQPKKTTGNEWLRWRPDYRPSTNMLGY